MEKKAKKLTEKDLEELKELLYKQLAFIEGDMEKMEADIDSSRNSPGSFSRVPTHPSDIGADNFEQDMTYERLEAEGYEVEDIRKALIKIENGDYGICEKCDSQINKKRLKAIPYCKHCLTCQEEVEKQENLH